MSLSVDGFWKAGFWTQTFWAAGFWYEGAVQEDENREASTSQAGGAAGNGYLIRKRAKQKQRERNNAMFLQMSQSALPYLLEEYRKKP